MAAGDYRSVLFWQGGPGQGFAYNVIHLRGAPGLADQSHCDDIGGVLESAIAASTGDQVWSDDVLLQHITLQELTAPPSAQFVSILGHQGLAIGDWLPPQVSLVTSLHTAHPGRSGRGRIYGWGYTETANGTNGQTAGVFASLQNDMWNAFLLQLGLAGDFELAVYSRKNDESYPVTSCTTNSVFDTQRRRIR